ncbi:MAG: 2-oxoacid:acceptor oxidoreductase family protein [Candidatus Omnitrophota bacterium]
MKEIRIHARAGQGAITTANILGEAYFIKGIYAYAFPHFGAARMGAPMNAFVRADEKPVRLRSQVYEPDFVIVVDSTLLRYVNCLSGLSENGIVIINQREGIHIPKAKLKQKICVVPANKIAQETIGRPLGNTALLGAYAAATGEIDLVTMQEAIKVRFTGKIQEGNLEAVKQGFEYIRKSDK